MGPQTNTKGQSNIGMTVKQEPQKVGQSQYKWWWECDALGYRWKYSKNIVYTNNAWSKLISVNNIWGTISLELLCKIWTRENYFRSY